MSSLKIIVLMLTAVNSGLCMVSKEWHNNISGGYIFSPDYPYHYPHNFNRRYTINAPADQIVVLTFEYFWTNTLENGDKTDYLKVFNGRKKDDSVGTDYYGFLATPFPFISSTRRVRMLFVTDYLGSARGFKIRYDFIDRKVHCPISSLQRDNVGKLSCSNEKAGFATECRVLCEDGYESQDGSISQCVDGTFSPITCEVARQCNISTLQAQKSSLVVCNNRSDDVIEDCRIECAQNYRLNGTNVINCVKGEYPTVNCTLQNELVTQCEDSNMTRCPYTFDEIIDYFDKYRLEVDSNVTMEEMMTEEAELENFPDPKLPGRTGKRLKCWPHYCYQSDGSYPFKCGRAKNKFWRKVCYYCRYKTRCYKPPPIYLG